MFITRQRRRQRRQQQQQHWRSTRGERARRFIILKMRYVVSYKMCCTLYFIGILRCVQQGQRERIKGRKMRKNCQLCITMASLMFNNRSNSQKKSHISLTKKKHCCCCFDETKSITIGKMKKDKKK